ncbi:MAG: hypothetical protein WAU65_01345 [Candidatus Nanoarchaeia archaeon]
MKIIYFGHPINFFNTQKELELIEIIKKEFPGFIIENPNQQNHIKSYQELKEKTGQGMPYYYEKVLPNMDAGIFLSLEDGKFGAGVFSEAEFLNNSKKPIYEINFQGRICPMIIDPSKKLSIEETVERRKVTIS